MTPAFIRKAVKVAATINPRIQREAKELDLEQATINPRIGEAKELDLEQATVNPRIQREAKELNLEQATINPRILRVAKDMVREQPIIINPRIQKAAKDMVREQETIINPRTPKAAKEVTIAILRGTHTITMMINILSTGMGQLAVVRVIIMTPPHRMLVDMSQAWTIIISGPQRDQGDMMMGMRGDRRSSLGPITGVGEGGMINIIE